MLFTMLSCSYPFERKEDNEDDPRTQTRVMQRILKGVSLRLPFPLLHVAKRSPSHRRLHEFPASPKQYRFSTEIRLGSLFAKTHSSIIQPEHPVLCSLHVTVQLAR